MCLLNFRHLGETNSKWYLKKICGGYYWARFHEFWAPSGPQKCNLFGKRGQKNDNSLHFNRAFIPVCAQALIIAQIINKIYPRHWLCCLGLCPCCLILWTFAGHQGQLQHWCCELQYCLFSFSRVWAWWMAQWLTFGAIEQLIESLIHYCDISSTAYASCIDFYLKYLLFFKRAAHIFLQYTNK